MSNQRSRLHSEANHLHPDLPGRSNLYRILIHLGNLEDRITAAFPHLAQGFTDAPLNPGTGQIVRPQPCQFTVRHAGGVAFITVLLPQNATPATAQLAQMQTSDNPNALLSTIVHRLQSASSASFDTSANVQTYGPSSQLHWALPDGNTLWRIQSSFDGKNFNPWSAPHT